MSDKKANARLRGLLADLDDATDKKERKDIDKKITRMGLDGSISIRSYWGIIQDHYRKETP